MKRLPEGGLCPTHTVILGPYEPINDYRVAAIDNGRMPIEFIQTTLSEIWDLARGGAGRGGAGRERMLYE